MKFSLDTFRMGYVIVYKTDGSLFSRIIEKRQLKVFKPEHASYIHVEVSGGGRHSININIPFSRLVDITKKHKGRYVCLLRYKNKDYERKGRYKIAYFSASLNNKPYDIRGVFRFLCKWVGQSTWLPFCSEGCLWSFRQEYPKILGDLKLYKCMPAHFPASKEFEKVWEGTIPEL